KWLGVATIVGVLPLVSPPVQAGPWEDFLATVVTESRLERLVAEVAATIEPAAKVPISVIGFTEQRDSFQQSSFDAATKQWKLDKTRKTIIQEIHQIGLAQNNVWKWDTAISLASNLPLEQTEVRQGSFQLDRVKLCIYGPLICFQDAPKPKISDPQLTGYLNRIEYVRGGIFPPAIGKKVEWSFVADSINYGSNREIFLVTRFNHRLSAEIVDIRNGCEGFHAFVPDCELLIIRQKEIISRAVHDKDRYKTPAGAPDEIKEEMLALDLRSGMLLRPTNINTPDIIGYKQWDIKLTGSLLSAQQASTQEDLKKSASLSPAQRETVRRKFRSGFELFQAGEFAAAELLFRDGLQIEPANEVANFYLAESLARLNKAAEARHYWQQT
ncbi:MAG: hypothetical protein B0A82_16740, partial [Alkalinema sp. CACIAM 70d]